MASAARHCPSWADLQPELLGLVLRRLSSLADRVRLAAVCGPWRRIAQQEPHLPPPLPWLTLLDGTFLSVPDGEIHRVQVPEDASIHGSAGNWLFLERPHGELALMDLFSQRIERFPSHVGRLPGQACSYPEDLMFLKLLPLSSTLDDHLSPDSLFAVLMMAKTTETVISICRRPSAVVVTAFRMPSIFDVAFFDWKLYALSLKELLAFEIVSSYQGKPRVSSKKCVAKALEDPEILHRSVDGKTYIAAYWSYLAVSNGKLLHVRRLVGALSTLPEKDRIKNGRTLSFQVFELDLTTNSCNKWRRLNTLGDQALFVGTHSKSLPASEYGAQKDCIYFVCDYEQRQWTIDPLCDCGVFNMRSGMITPLLLDTTRVRSQGCKGRPTWVFPTKAM